jgi:hypothetical protein
MARLTLKIGCAEVGRSWMFSLVLRFLWRNFSWFLFLTLTNLVDSDKKEPAPQGRESNFKPGGVFVRRPANFLKVASGWTK